MILQHLTLTWRSPPPSLLTVVNAGRPRWLTVPALSLRSVQGAWATWQQPLEIVSIRVMYSTPFSLLSSRAANFLLLGYTNCSISILHWAAAGSWGSTRHWWPVPAIVITTLERLFVWVCRTNAASVLLAFFSLSPFVTMNFQLRKGKLAPIFEFPL